MTATITKTPTTDEVHGLGTMCPFEKEKDALTGERRYTYCGLEELYKAHKEYFDFMPTKFKSFDGRIAHEMEEINHTRLQGIYDKGAAHYSEDAAIRKNIALVRMWIYTQYFPNGEYDPYNRSHREAQNYLNQMGATIAEIFQNEQLARRPENLVTFRRPKEKTFAEQRFGDLGSEHIGAQTLYKRLVEIQNRKTVNPLMWMNGKTYSKNWGLPPVEESPFRDRDIEEAIAHDAKRVEAGAPNAAAALVSDALWTFEVNYNLAHAISKPQGLPDAEAEQAVILAKYILDELKKMKFTPSDQEMDSIELRDKHVKDGYWETQLCMEYQKIILDLAAHDPTALAGDPAFVHAQEAIGKLGYLTLQKAKEEAYRVEDADLAHKLMKEERNIPDQYKLTDVKEEAKLIQKIETAIQQAVMYRDRKTQRHVMQHAGIQLSPQAAQLVQNEMTRNKQRIDATTMYVAGVSTTKANWAIHAAKMFNQERSIQSEQRQLTSHLRENPGHPLENQSLQIAQSALNGEQSQGEAQRRLLEQQNKPLGFDRRNMN